MNQGRGRPRKLTDAQVVEIRAWRAAMDAMPSCADMARRMGVSMSRIAQVARGYSYKEVGR